LKKILTLIAFSVLLLVPVWAQNAYSTTVETDIPITVTCTNPPNVQLCVPLFSTNVETESELKVKYTVTSHCSSIRVHVFLDGNFVTTSEFFGWVQSPPPPPFDVLPLMTPIIDLGPVTPGTHQVSLQGEGQVSGCNSGGLGVWTGTLTTFTNEPSESVSHSHDIEFGPTILGPTAVVSSSSLVMTECPPGHVMTGFTAQSFSMQPKCTPLSISDVLTMAVGGMMIQVNAIALLAAGIGVDPLVTGLLLVTVVGISVQVTWILHKKKN